MLRSQKNILISDHSTIVAALNRDSIKDKEETKINFCSTKVPKYNLKGATAEAWHSAKEDLKKVSFNENLDPEDLCNELITTLENIVVKNFTVHAPPSREGKSSGSYIPREARCLLRRKLNASRALKKTAEPEAQSKLKDKIKVIEDDLRKAVHKKRQNEENKAKGDLINNPENFFKLVRKLTKKSDKVGPLKRTKENLNWPSCEILSSQYSSVFSTPRPEDIFADPEAFFSDNLQTDNNDKNKNGLGDGGSTGNALPPPPPTKKKSKNTTKGMGDGGSTGNALPPPPPTKKIQTIPQIQKPSSVTTCKLTTMIKTKMGRGMGGQLVTPCPPPLPPKKIQKMPQKGWGMGGQLVTPCPPPPPPTKKCSISK